MKYSTADFVEKLHQLANEPGHPPTLQDLRDYGEISPTTYYERFGS